MDDLPARAGWKYTGVKLSGYPEAAPAPLYFRSLADCIKSLVGQPHLAPHMIWSPERHYAKSPDDLEHGETLDDFRMYCEMNTADWWWEEQATLPDGTTILALMFSTDETQLTMFSGDKKAYPLYLTLGNIPAHLRRREGMLSRILIGYLPCGTESSIQGS